MKNAEPTLDHGGLMGTTDMAPGKKKRKQKKLRRLPLNISGDWGYRSA